MIFAPTQTRAVGVDREQNVIRGVVLCTVGIFKTRRGQFDLAGLERVQQLAAQQKAGLRSYFKHPTENEPDALDRFLGRIKNPYMSKVTVERAGQRVALDAVRGDLHLSPVSLKPPPGGGTPYGEFVLDLAESDSDALSASLALRAEKIRQLDRRGRPATDEAGELLPPLWQAIEIAGLDIVSQGDASPGLLGFDVTDEFDPLFGVTGPAETLLGQSTVADYRPALAAVLDSRLVAARWRNRKRKAGVL